jgi:hypothetical protein
MPVVTTSVATAATDAAAATVSSSQSVILVVFRIHAHTVSPRSPTGRVHDGRFPSRRLLVAGTSTVCGPGYQVFVGSVFGPPNRPVVG